MAAGQSFVHDLRGQLNTIRLSAAVLTRERDLTEIGKMALKRIDEAIDRAGKQLSGLEEPVSK